MKPIKIFECYAGYGGASFGLQKAKIPYECIGYSEIDKRQIQIYEMNHPNVKNYGDITKINIDELPDFDMISGGFPCQDVSIAGLRDLKKGRTKSVFKMLDIIKVKKPKYCLLENVEGILSMLNGELLREIVRQLKSIGYAVSYQVLKSKDFGIPQNRPRVWIACELDKIPFMFNPFPPKEELKIFVKDILEKEVAAEYYLSKPQVERTIYKSNKRNKILDKRLNPLVANTLTTYNPKSTGADSIFVNDFIIHSAQPRTSTTGKGGSGHLQRDDGISSTIDTKNSQYIQLDQTFRVLTPKECFRLMGFLNDEIKIDGMSKTALYFSAGNGWDVNLVSKIMEKWLK